MSAEKLDSYNVYSLHPTNADWYYLRHYTIKIHLITNDILKQQNIQMYSESKRPTNWLNCPHTLLLKVKSRFPSQLVKQQ